MQFLNKNIPTLAGIIVIAVAALIVGGVAMWQRKLIQVENFIIKTLLKNETAGWKTYMKNIL